MTVLLLAGQAHRLRREGEFRSEIVVCDSSKVASRYVAPQHELHLLLPASVYPFHPHQMST